MQKGLTLIEVLIAAAVLIVSCSLVFLLFTNCIILNESNRNLTLAVSHAQYILEEIKNTNFSSIKTSIDGGTWDWTIATLSGHELTALTNEEITTSEAGTDPDLLNITVTVNWQDRGGRNRTITMQTLMAEL
jgi:Tfp pilus assembly protein PilE